MVIGTFLYDAMRDIYIGEISTLALRCHSVELRPAGKDSDEDPDYEVVDDGAGGPTELGQAWKRQAKRGDDYLSVVLDDPSLLQPLQASLMLTPDGSRGLLIWSRPGRGGEKP